MTVSVIKLDNNQFGVVCDKESLKMLAVVFGAFSCGTEDFGWYDGVADMCCLENVDTTTHEVVEEFRDDRVVLKYKENK